MDGRKHGRPEEEMFLRNDNSNAETPTIGPLRINKASSASPAQPRPNSADSDTNPFTAPQASAVHYPTPVSKPSAAPLPYPDNDEPPHARAAPPRQYTPLSDRDGARRTGTPDSGMRRTSSTTHSGSPRPRFSANDPNRPTVSGYSHSPVQGDASQQPSLAERRGNVPKPLPDSPGPETPDKDDLFQRPPQRSTQSPPQAGYGAPGSSQQGGYQQTYYPPPAAPSSSAGYGGGLHIPNPGGVNRLSSTASTSTTKAQRGSPPPPETPAVDQPGGGIEARYAAAGIAGTSTLNSIQAQNAAAQQRAAQYAQQAPRQNTSTPQQPQQPPQRPWTPTEDPASHPHGTPVAFQGVNEVTPGSQSASPPQASRPEQFSPPASGRHGAQDELDEDMGRLNVGEEPPPAYSSVARPAQGTSNTAQGYPNEKRSTIVGGQAAPGVTPVSGQSVDSGSQGHPAFHNEQQAQTAASISPQPLQQQTSLTPDAAQQYQQQQSQQQSAQSPSPGPGAGPASPPPLPEGWIAHLDPNSGQYYYIHLPTQSTQWEFPKGPTPLNLSEPLSPTGTVNNFPLSSPSMASFSGKPLASPGFPSQQANYRYSDAMSMAGLSSPTAAGFSGPPPIAGVDMYKIAPTNGVYFGPYLRYTNMDIERGIWLGSILLITDAPQPPTIHIHQSVDLSPNPRQLKANPIYSHHRWMFYRYDVDLRMEDDHGAKWTYAITSHLGCTRYEFLVAGRYETSWRFIAHSGNDFALNVKAEERSRLGGVGFMWKDILQKHVECGGFHAQLGLGDQIYADRLWKEVPMLRQWTATSGKDNRKNAPWTAKHEEDVTHAYFHYYTSHFDQPHLREAFAQIPHVLSLDDHDM